MKKSTLVIFLALAMVQTQAQDYLVSFAAAGDTNEVNTVKVQNLTSGDTLTLNGGDILHLTFEVGINAPDMSNGYIKLYPNPMTGQSTLTFTAQETGNVVISIFDITGRSIHQVSTQLSTGIHNFCISGISRGMYLVKVTSKNYGYSEKLISQSDLPRSGEIEYVSSVSNPKVMQIKSTDSLVGMQYTDGDLLLFKGISGKYSTIVTDVPTSSKTITFDFAECKDSEGNNYTVVKIGAQTWMAENLNVGVRINGIQEQTNNGIIEKYCYNNDENNCDIYGGLYQWDEMMQYITTPAVLAICPAGWHVPTDEEWTTVTTFLGGTDVAGGKMKSTGTIEAGTGLWYSPNTGATNESGFSAVPAGYRLLNGAFGDDGHHGYWWSSSEYDTYDAWYRDLFYYYNGVSRYYANKSGGFSARCLKNEFNDTILNVPGTYQGWNPADTNTVIRSRNADEKYEGYQWFPANTAFKYAKGSWAWNWGDDGADGTLEPGGANIQAGMTGYYWLNADLVALTHNFLRTTWGVIGSSTPGGWDNETEMTFDTISKVWTITLNLTAGEILFRANHSWDLFYGDNDADGTLEQNGAHILVPETGNYTVRMDLGKAVYSYQLTNNSLFTCGSSVTINHVAGVVAPVNKTVTYGTVTNIPGEPAKCWITSNLGADHQATAKNDATEASAGWYWQFNRKQGYKHDGTTRTPNTVWIDYIGEYFDWQSSDDPCTHELGSGWRVPTYNEWNNVFTAGGWTNWNGPWNSGLKMHAAGYLDPSDGSLGLRGTTGYYWSSTQYYNYTGWLLYFNSGYFSMYQSSKSRGLSLRCLRESTSTIPTVITAPIIDINQTTATGGGEVTDDGGSEVTSRGFCWSTSPYPTIIDNHTMDGTGTGPFISNLTGLTPETTYYARAYATNNAGTAYGAETSFTTLTPVPQPCTGTPTVEYEGQTYNTVQIGTQCWLKENLNVGTRINGNQEQTDNGIIEKYCYDNDPTMCDIFGGLYQWNEMMQYITTDGARGICPEGWHLPDVTEGQLLTAFLGDLTVAGGKMKEAGYVHWAFPNTGATNSSGLTALPGGVRSVDGLFMGLTTNANFWSSQYDAITAWGLSLSHNSEAASVSNGFEKSTGFSARCIRDVPVYYPLLNVPGSYQGWNPADSTTVIASRNADERYEGYIWFPANTEFKYAKGTWNMNWGDNWADGTLEPNGANIIAGEEGYYKLNVDLVGLTHTFLKTAWSVIGSATPGGWGYDTEMTYDAINKVWSVTMDLTYGEIRFRANGAWDLSYGDDGANGTLEPDGANIAVPEEGNYTINMNLGNPVYTYQLTRNGSFTKGFANPAVPIVP